MVSLALQLPPDTLTLSTVTWSFSFGVSTFTTRMTNATLVRHPVPETLMVVPIGRVVSGPVIGGSVVRRAAWASAGEAQNIQPITATRRENPARRIFTAFDRGQSGGTIAAAPVVGRTAHPP